MGCPDPSALQEFLDAPPETPRSDELKAHFQRCGDCRELVLALGGEGAAATRMIGRYEVLGRIGQGGMGVVYAARDPDLDRKVALKLLRHVATSDDDRAGKERQTRLMREAQAMARLNHPNVIIVHDVGSDEEGVFIAMEFVEGETMSRWLQRSRPRAEVLALVLAAGRGLAAAHAAGLVHRDFKPDNVLVGSDGRVRVTDFGLARLALVESISVRSDATPSPLELTLTGAGALIGTPAYMAPEQLDGAATDARSDVFSFCVVLFEALTGQRPFVGGNLQELRDAIARNRLAVASSERLPRRLRRVIARGLRATPAERYGDMNALLAAIETACRPPRPRGALAVGAAAALASALLVARAAHLQSQRAPQQVIVPMHVSGSSPPAPLLRTATTTMTPIAPPPIAPKRATRGQVRHAKSPPPPSLSTTPSRAPADVDDPDGAIDPYADSR
jgi:serine/threonine protein kinase